jgi:hypothetical protein
MTYSSVVKVEIQFPIIFEDLVIMETSSLHG